MIEAFRLRLLLRHLTLTNYAMPFLFSCRYTFQFSTFFLAFTGHHVMAAKQVVFGAFLQGFGEFAESEVTTFFIQAR